MRQGRSLYAVAVERAPAAHRPPTVIQGDGPGDAREF
jgi:hypothetical protein